MKELSPTARALLEAGVEAEESPSSRDRARVQARLTALLGASAFGAAASQAAAMASVASGTSAASGGAAATGMASVASGTSAASGGAAATGGVSGAASSGLASAGGAHVGAAVSGASAAGTAVASVGTSLFSAGGTGAAVGGASGLTGWVAALGAKGVAWIGAAALSAAVGTTAVVSRHSEETALEARVVAVPSRSTARRVEQQLPAAEPSRDVAAVNAQDAQAIAVPEPEAALAPASRQLPIAVRAAKTEATPQPSLSERAERASAPKRVPAAAPSAPAANPALDTGISESRLAAMAASSSEVRNAGAAPRAPDAPDDEELLPQPTDPDAMNAVAASPREPERAPPLPATDATTPSHAINPGSPISAAPAAVGDAAPQPGVALSGELRLLADAQRALHDGKLSLALTLLDQHGREHARGALIEERLAARAVVLCRLQELGPGNAEAQRLAALTPRSPLLPWVRSACNKP